MAHRLVRALARLLLSLFYRRVRIHGIERVPESGPIVVCANHHGSLVDPLVLLAEVPRRLRPLAKAPLFQIPIIRPFLSALSALPVYRPQDRHLVTGSNAGLFAACREALARGDAILIFPEGLSKPQPVLSPLRPGAARMALEAEADNDWALGVQIVPIAIHLQDAARFRRGEVVLEVAPPLTVADLRWAHSASAIEATGALTEQLRAALSLMLIEIESSDDHALLRLSVRAWSRERGLTPDSERELDLARAFAFGYRAAKEHDPSLLEPLRQVTQTYRRTLRHFRLTGDELDLSYSFWSVVGFLLRQSLVLLVAAPVGLAGTLINEPVVRLANVVAARMSEEEDSWASFQLGVALAAFPLYWSSIAIAVAAWFGWQAGAVAGAVLPVASLWALRFGEIGVRFRDRIHAFLLLAGEGALKRHLSASRRAVHDEVERLRASLDSKTDPTTEDPPAASDSSPTS